MESLTPEFQAPVSPLQPVLPDLREISKRVREAKTDEIGAQVLKNFIESLQPGPGEIQAGKEEPPPLKRKREAKAQAEEPPRKKKKLAKREAPTHISSLPPIATATIASHLSIADQEALAAAAAVSAEAGSITLGVTEAQRFFLKSVCKAAGQEERDELYSLTGAHFPSLHAINRMSDHEVWKFIASLENTLKRVWEDISPPVREMYKEISSNIDLKNPTAVIEILAASHAHNLAAIGDALGGVECKEITTKDELFNAAKAAAKNLTKYSDQITSIVITSNNVTSIPLEVTRLKNLDRLLLSANKVAFVPKELENLTALRALDISNNPIKINSFDQFLNIPNLTVLYIATNQLLPPLFNKHGYVVPRKNNGKDLEIMTFFPAA